MVEVLVKSWTNYQLYYRDPDTRHFKPITDLDRSKWSVQFNPSRIGDHKPIRFIKFKMEPKGFDHQRYSRKINLKVIDL